MVPAGSHKEAVEGSSLTRRRKRSLGATWPEAFYVIHRRHKCGNGALFLSLCNKYLALVNVRFFPLLHLPYITKRKTYRNIRMICDPRRSMKKDVESKDRED
jgi:hypothetical protein